MPHCIKCDAKFNILTAELGAKMCKKCTPIKKNENWSGWTWTPKIDNAPKAIKIARITGGVYIFLGLLYIANFCLDPSLGFLAIGSAFIICAGLVILRRSVIAALIITIITFLLLVVNIFSGLTWASVLFYLFIQCPIVLAMMNATLSLKRNRFD